MVSRATSRGRRVTLVPNRRRPSFAQKPDSSIAAES